MTGYANPAQFTTLLIGVSGGDNFVSKEYHHEYRFRHLH
ncbi:hypothetical protein QMN27_12405 [Enterobacter asburiae]|nr:hypothetical protein [Enterobacter asburiae]